MRLSKRSVALSAALSLLLPTSTLANIVNSPSQIAESYDFVICGGGLAGLVLASRLSEDSNHTVLVLEAGASGDAVKEQIDVPANAYYSSLLGTSYDWQFTTQPQVNAGDRSLPWARGKVIGGSTAVNGMYLVRPSDIEINVWESLLANMTGSGAWGWDSLFAAMKKSEIFTPPSAAIQAKGAIEYNNASHGFNGPLHYAYPGFLLDIVGDWTATLDWIGIPPSPDPSGGYGAGAFIATSAINPANWTRSYSRSAYIDPLPPRSNLQILPNATVTRIIFAGNGTSGGTEGLNATGVEWAASATGKRQTVTVNKEVIVCGGAIMSPSILMHSGIGPADVLKNAGVAVQYALPGVGQHLQDHISTEVVFKTTSATSATLHDGNSTDQSGTLGSFINSAIAYANVTDLLGNYSDTFHTTDVNGQLQTSLSTLVPSTDPTVIAGYKAIYQATADQILMTRAGQVELLFSLTGTTVGGADSIAIQAALQHPYSQGHLYINSSNPFDYPVIDPAYLSHPADITLLREGLKLARTLGQTQPLNGTIESEVSPGSAVVTDADWNAWIPTVIGTEYHPSCSCAMLPLELGGVVDANLKVYGTANVRVVDSSVFPIQFACHLMAPTYGLAEQAAEIIRAQYNNVAPPGATTISATGSETGTATSSASTSTKTKSKSAALPSSVISGRNGLLGLIVAGAMWLVL